jgi:hypothetical protein
VDVRSKLKVIPIFFLISLGVNSCVRTGLTADPAPRSLSKLAHLNNRPIRLEVEAPQSPISLGHQYLLIVIPFGRITLEEPKKYIFNLVYEDLVLKGFSPVTAHGTKRELRVKLESMNATAYDLLFIRLVRCSVDLDINFNGLHFIAQGSASSFRRYGFKPQIEELLKAASKDAMQDMLSKSLYP